ncbi:MAG: ATP-binding cassette domain-containing protein [Lachnospiraceae bacterium]|nr:ATP-binding cassette domain-containing protein [Lachnospiraceae bacterium]
MSIFVDIEKNLGSFHLKVKFESGNNTLALLGASGCGKSMTLKCIAGIERPDRGRIVVDGITLFDSENHINLTPQERRVGLMFQNYALFPNMTVLQNIRTGAKREKDKARREEMVAQVMESFGLAPLAGRYPHQLSGGQQQRVALARILVSDPHILLLDEPFSALDSHLRFKLEQEVRSVIRSFGKSVLLVSHDRDEVFRMADRIAVMENGRIDAIGTKKEVFDDPKTRTGAILTGCKNISAAKLRGDGRIDATDWGMELTLGRNQAVNAISTEETVTRQAASIQYVGVRMHDIQLLETENAGATGASDKAGKSAEVKTGTVGEEVLVCPKNTFHCQVVEEIENPFSMTILLRPVESSHAMPIGLETNKETWKLHRGEIVAIHIPAESILLLEERET